MTQIEIIKCTGGTEKQNGLANFQKSLKFDEIHTWLFEHQNRANAVEQMKQIMPLVEKLNAIVDYKFWIEVAPAEYVTDLLKMMRNN